MQDAIERFWSKVDKSTGPSACWPWLRGVDKDGYGKFWFNDKDTRAHRFAYELVKGELKDEVALHSCDNPRCCNPEHIHDGTQAQNQHEKVQRGRSLIGERHHQARLREEQAIAIKNMSREGIKLTDIARHFNITKSHAWLVINRTWKYLDR